MDKEIKRAADYQLDDLVSRIWAVCVDTHFHYDALPNDEECAVDAALLAQEGCRQIKALLGGFDAEGLLLRKYIYIFRDVLRKHWLADIYCKHAMFPGDDAYDRPSCACSEVQFPNGKNVGEAVEMWINHVFVVAAVECSDTKAVANGDSKSEGT